MNKTPDLYVGKERNKEKAMRYEGQTQAPDLRGLSLDDANRVYLDHRYGFVKCLDCGTEWQRIDFGCAHHELLCRLANAKG